MTERLNRVHLLLVEMARTIKVTVEKAAKEWAREAGDKKKALMKRVKEANKRRAQRIKGRKEKQLKVEREEKRKEREKYREGCRPSKKYKNIKKGQTC